MKHGYMGNTMKTHQEGDGRPDVENPRKASTVVRAGNTHGNVASSAAERSVLGHD